MENNAKFGHGVIWTIFEKGLGIYKVMGVTWWGGARELLENF